MYQHTVWKLFDQLYQIRYINRKIHVAAYSLGSKLIIIYKAALYDDIKLSVIRIQGRIWTVLSFVVHIKHMYVYFFRSCVPETIAFLVKQIFCYFFHISAINQNQKGLTFKMWYDIFKPATTMSKKRKIVSVEMI